MILGEIQHRPSFYGSLLFAKKITEDLILKYCYTGLIESDNSCFLHAESCK
jgi:hypothetical protein